MSLEVCLSASVKYKRNAGGAAWQYLNWALGLRALDCQVIWLETVNPRTAENDLREHLTGLKNWLELYGLSGCLALCSPTGQPLPWDASGWYIPFRAAASEADLFLNLGYFPECDLACFRRSAFLDTDPGLMQIWMNSGKLNVPRHDVYFTESETVGTPDALVPDCGLRWHYTPLPLFLPLWPVTQADPSASFTTVSNWWGDFMEFQGEWLSNEKRTAFLDYLELPSRTSVPLELALTLTSSAVDAEERRSLEQKGWKVRSLWEINWTPEDYRNYVQQSRGEFTCAKPFFVRLQSALIYDRTLHYMASGKPAVVQHTGPSKFLPDAEGLFRFHNIAEAASALDAVVSDYDRHSRLARALVEEYFDARKVVSSVLERALE